MCQAPPHHEFKQGQNVQANGQQPEQSGGVIIALQVHWVDRQRAAFQASAAPLYQILIAIGQDGLLLPRRVCDIHAPAFGTQVFSYGWFINGGLRPDILVYHRAGETVPVPSNRAFVGMHCKVQTQQTWI